MKPFQTLLFLAVMVLIGGMAALYWGKSIQDATAPVEVVEEPTTEPAEEELAPGSYLVFQSVTTTDAGTQDWSNDDTDTYTYYRLALGEATYRVMPSVDDLVEIVSVVHGPNFSGSLTTNILGQNLLMHRYESTREFDEETGMPTEGEEGDGLLSLEGEVIETSKRDLPRLQSSNGLYEVRFEFGLDSPSQDFGTYQVYNVSTGELIVQHRTTLDSGEEGNPEPFLIDDKGRYLYIRQVCGCEATLSGLWMIDVQTGEATRLDELVDLDSWFLSSLDMDARRLLSISTDREPSQDGPYDELLPPTTIRILDLESLESDEFLIDEERAWDRPWLDPQGNDRYVVRLWDEGNSLYLVNFDDTEIVEDHFLTDGWVLDWVGDWLVVQNTQDSTLKLVNVESKEEVLLEIPGERVEYIGSIELK